MSPFCSALPERLPKLQFQAHFSSTHKRACIIDVKSSGLMNQHTFSTHEPLFQELFLSIFDISLQESTETQR
jgi:hypothetical protein